MSALVRVHRFRNDRDVYGMFVFVHTGIRPENVER